MGRGEVMGLVCIEAYFVVVQPLSEMPFVAIPRVAACVTAVIADQRHYKRTKY
jgi:hypothetical protein